MRGRAANQRQKHTKILTAWHGGKCSKRHRMAISENLTAVKNIRYHCKGQIGRSKNVIHLLVEMLYCLGYLLEEQSKAVKRAEKWYNSQGDLECACAVSTLWRNIQTGYLTLFAYHNNFTTRKLVVFVLTILRP